MPPESTTSRELVRRLIERQPVRPDASDSAPAAVQGACEDVYLVFARWVGREGGRALFTRALASAAREHSVLKGINVHGDGGRLDGVDAATQSAGAGATAAGLEAMLIEVIELMGRFIGEDMVANLVERNPGSDPEAGGQSAGRSDHGR